MENTHQVLLREATLTKFVITGGFDEASAQLKANFDAQNASFNANLAALSTARPSPAAPVKPAAVHLETAGWSLSVKRPAAPSRRFGR